MYASFHDIYMIRWAIIIVVLFFVLLCIRERERERDRQTETEREREREREHNILRIAERKKNSEITLTISTCTSSLPGLSIASSIKSFLFVVPITRILCSACMPSILLNS